MKTRLSTIILMTCTLCGSACMERSELNAYTRTEVDTESDTNTGAHYDSESDTGRDMNTDTGTDTGADTGTDTGMDTDTDSGSDVETGSGADTASESGTDSGTGTENAQNVDSDTGGSGDTTSDMGDTFNVDTDTFQNTTDGQYDSETGCEIVGESVRTCDDLGNVKVVDPCGQLIRVETCSETNGECRDGVCGCEAGWSNKDCSRCRIYVNIANTSGSGSGHNWETAFSSLQMALDAAEEDGCEVWVAKGVYHPEADESGDRTPDDPKTVTFLLRPGVTLYGGFEGLEWRLEERDTKKNETILSGDINNDDADNLFEYDEDNSYHVLTVYDSERLDGFTITGGRGDTSDSYSGYGGGLLQMNAELYIENCIFTANVANFGGAIYNFGGRPKIENCRFEGNQGNSITSAGGAIYNSSTFVYISNSIFKSNHSPGGAGALFSDSSDGYVYNSEFSDNSSAVANSDSSPVFSNCTFAYNRSGAYGQYWVISNSAGSSPTIRNSIFWHNYENRSVAILNDAEDCQPTISYSNLQSGECSSIEHAICGAGNLSVDPDFVNAEQSDFRLFASSACINSGQNDLVEKDHTDLDEDGIAAEASPYDVAGLPRVNTDDAVGIVDMGAHEY